MRSDWIKCRTYRYLVERAKRVTFYIDNRVFAQSLSHFVIHIQLVETNWCIFCIDALLFNTSWRKVCIDIHLMIAKTWQDCSNIKKQKRFSKFWLWKKRTKYVWMSVGSYNWKGSINFRWNSNELNKYEREKQFVDAMLKFN